MAHLPPKLAAHHACEFPGQGCGASTPAQFVHVGVSRPGRAAGDVGFGVGLGLG